MAHFLTNYKSEFKFGTLLKFRTKPITSVGHGIQPFSNFVHTNSLYKQTKTVNSKKKPWTRDLGVLPFLELSF